MSSSGGGGGGGTGAAAAAAAGRAQAVEVETADVVKLILQFCKENRLLHTMRTLQEEAQVRSAGGIGGGVFCLIDCPSDPFAHGGDGAQVAMNTVDSMENFLADVAQGRWEAVLPQVAGLRLPQDKLLGACVLV